MTWEDPKVVALVQHVTDLQSAMDQMKWGEAHDLCGLISLMALDIQQNLPQVPDDTQSASLF